MRRTMIAAGAGVLLATTALVPATQANAGTGKGKLCDFGTFHVIHKGNRIDDVKVRQGYYKIYHREVRCRAASNYLRAWLATGETTDGFLVATGTRGKNSLMFSKGQGPKFFQIKRVRKG